MIMMDQEPDIHIISTPVYKKETEMRINKRMI